VLIDQLIKIIQYSPKVTSIEAANTSATVFLFDREMAGIERKRKNPPFQVGWKISFN
jgi:hypothetical protein